MNLRNVSAHEVIIDFATFDEKDPRQSKHEKHTIAPGQIVMKVPETWQKHAQWAQLTAKDVVAPDGTIITRGGPLQPVEV